MEQFEMKELSDLSKIVEHLADFAGDLMLQLARKQPYVEKAGIKALLDHINSGGNILTTMVAQEHARDLRERMEKKHIPYVEIERRDPNSKEVISVFLYRDCDMRGMEKVLREFAMALEKDSHEVDIDTFCQLCDKQAYGAVGNLTREEIHTFREVAKDYRFWYSIVDNGEKFGIVCSDKQGLRDAISDMSYNLSGDRGHSYYQRLTESFEKEAHFLLLAKPERGKVKYIVDVRNPRNLITIDEQGITKHSIGFREESLPNGRKERFLYDERHETYPGFDSKKVIELSRSFRCPIVLSPEEFPLVLRISPTKEAVLSKDYMDLYSEFMKKFEYAKPDLPKEPKRGKLYSMDNVRGYTSLPNAIISELHEHEVKDIFIDGSDVAWEKSHTEIETFIMDAAKRLEITVGRPEIMDEEHPNQAMKHMLNIENDEKLVLKSGNISDISLLNEVQREAMEKTSEKEIQVQKMMKEQAKALREATRDKQLSKDMDR